jgi:hypothetical protein
MDKLGLQPGDPLLSLADLKQDFGPLGSLREWNRVPLVTLNLLRQPEHFQRTGVSASV